MALQRDRADGLVRAELLLQARNLSFFFFLPENIPRNITFSYIYIRKASHLCCRQTRKRFFFLFFLPRGSPSSFFTLVFETLQTSMRLWIFDSYSSMTITVSSIYIQDNEYKKIYSEYLYKLYKPYVTTLMNDFFIEMFLRTQMRQRSRDIRTERASAKRLYDIRSSATREPWNTQQKAAS